MDPISDEALRTVTNHEATSIVRQLRTDNERLRNELATAKANLRNRYLRSVLNLVDKHRDMGTGSVEVSDWRLVLQSEYDDEGDSIEMLNGLYRLPLEEKLAIIPVLCGLGYGATHEWDIHCIGRNSNCPFSVHWNHAETKVEYTNHCGHKPQTAAGDG